MVDFVIPRECGKSFIILGTGPSAAAFEEISIPPGVQVIGVNGAILKHSCHHWFTLDPSESNLAIMNNPMQGVFYWAAVPENFGTVYAPTVEMRRPPPPYINYLKRITGHGILSSKHGLSETPGEIHTGNSAWGALQLAVQLGAKEILLIGVDATQDEYAIGQGRPRGSLAHVPNLFESAKDQLARKGIAVGNITTNQAMPFTQVQPEQAYSFFRWAHEQ